MSSFYRYIERYAEDGHEAWGPRSEHLLDRYNRAKGEYLFKLFGGEKVLRKEYGYEISEEELRLQMCKLSQKIYGWEWYKKIKETGVSCPPSIEELMKNTYMESEKVLYNAEGKKFVIRKGAKLMRLLSKLLVHFYGETFDFEDFRLEHSRILNQKTITGTLCLSIDPIDYVTMSDNDCGWQSCMNWIHQGCCRTGTIEMLNSHCVVVAYLASATPFYPFAEDEEDEVSNKKWRTLAIITPALITTIKGYPYQNESLSLAVASWLQELAEKNLGWTYPEEPHPWVWNAELYRHINLSTSIMYNDFGECDYHYGILPAFKYSLNYSGEAQCMNCGVGLDPEDESEVLCRDCSAFAECACCEEWFLKEDLDDEGFCEKCRKEEE